MPRGYGKFRTMPLQSRRPGRTVPQILATDEGQAALRHVNSDAFWLERARDEHLARMRNGIEAPPSFEDFITTTRLDEDGNIHPEDVQNLREVVGDIRTWKAQTTAMAEMQRLIDRMPRREWVLTNQGGLPVWQHPSGARFMGTEPPEATADISQYQQRWQAQPVHRIDPNDPNPPFTRILDRLREEVRERAEGELRNTFLYGTNNPARIASLRADSPVFRELDIHFDEGPSPNG